MLTLRGYDTGSNISVLGSLYHVSEIFMGIFETLNTSETFEFVMAEHVGAFDNR